MSPDIEWHIGEEAEEDSVIRAASSSRAHWHTTALIVAVSLGLSLGLLYTSIPEPPPRPAAPSPVTPRSATFQMLATDAVHSAPPHPETVIDENTRFNLLAETIEREVNALADGDEAAFLTLQDQNDRDWLNTQQQGFHSWGRPPAKEQHPGALYFYSGIPSGVAFDQESWVDIRQYRQGGMFRETRFYRWQSDHWVRARPALDFWNDVTAETLTPRFQLELPQVDSVFAVTLMQRLENAYQQICLDLACPAQVLTPTMPIRVLISPELAPQQSWVVFDGRITLHLPSPRTTGLLETNTPIDSGDPLTQLLYVRLSEIVARTLSGGDTRWSANSNGMLYLSSVARWELQRHFPQMDLNTYIGAALLRDRKITLPKYLWDWPVRDSRRLVSPQAQTNSVVAFIDRSYGVQGVIKFLQTLNTAQSLPQAIEASLPISYASFEQQWQHWLDTRLRE